MVGRQSLESTWMIISKELAKPARNKTLLGLELNSQLGSFRMCWIHHPERGGCCTSTCAGPQNDDFLFPLQAFWRGRAEGNAKRKAKKELRWVLRDKTLISQRVTNWLMASHHTGLLGPDTPFGGIFLFFNFPASFFLAELTVCLVKH